MTTAIVVANVTVPESIVFQFADSDECVEFFRDNVKALSSKQRQTCYLAHARALFREGRDLLVEQVALLSSAKVKQVIPYLTKFSGREFKAGDKVDNLLAARALMNMVEF